MFLDIASDLHLVTPNDLSDQFFVPYSSILILAGDICESRQIEVLKPFFERLSKTWSTILYIPGNHEFYKGGLDHTVIKMRHQLSEFKNIHVMDNDVIQLEGITFICSTLWSDMEKSNPQVMFDCQRFISDYFYIHTIKDGMIQSISPRDTVQLFKSNIKYIKQMLKNDQDNKIVVLTHHAPSVQSVSPQFKQSALNGAFVSNLESLILSNPGIKCWIHGHTHSEIDYYIGGCRVVCHPKGYRDELYFNSSDYVPFTVEV